MPNPFDQFDAPRAGSNPFDQFDAPAAPGSPSMGRRLLNFANPIAGAEMNLSMLSSMAAQPIAGLAGIGASVIPGGRPAADVTNSVMNAMTYQPRTRGGQERLAEVGEGMGMIERFADWAGEKTGAPGDTLGATGVKTALLALPMALGARGARAPTRIAPAAERPVVATRPRPEPAPSVEQLRAQSTAAYQAADDAGVVISRDAMARIVEEIKNEVAGEGIDATMHPQALAALQRLMDAGKEHTSLKGAEILRRVIKDAGETPTNPANARMANIIRDAFDERIEALGGGDVLTGNVAEGVGALQSARSLYARARKGADIEELFHRAELRAGANYTVAGLETALRQEFKSLALNKRRMRGYSAEERAAIERVATGGGRVSIENAMRLLGKFAPSGNLSAALSAGLGFMAGGPAGAVGLPILGTAAKYGAGRLTMRNANAASELVRRGPTNALYSEPPSNALIPRRP